MSKKFTLTKEEFIKRSMNGEVFIFKGDRYFYDSDYINPFRFNSSPLYYTYWSNINGENLFTLEEPKPIIERRWRWQRDANGISYVSEYMSDTYAEKYDFPKLGYFKRENDYIDVEVKQ